VSTQHLNVPVHSKIINLIFIVFLGYFRFEISDNGRSEGSEDSLPNETTVKFINEVSSKVCLFVCFFTVVCLKTCLRRTQCARERL